MMRRSRAYLIGSLMATLAITALGAPAAAAETGSVAIVNGIPGGKVDICLGSQEIRSGLPYGGRVFRSPAAGSRVLKVYRADPRTCKGTLLAKKGFTLVAGGDLTLVATVKAPKVVIFDNAGLGTVVPSGADVYAPWAWRHAADIGKVNFRFHVSSVSGYHLIQPEPYISNLAQGRPGDLARAEDGGHLQAQGHPAGQDRRDHHLEGGHPGGRSPLRVVPPGNHRQEREVRGPGPSRLGVARAGPTAWIG